MEKRNLAVVQDMNFSFKGRENLTLLKAAQNILDKAYRALADESGGNARPEI